MGWLNRIFGSKNEQNRTVARDTGWICSQCMGNYPASSIVILPWWNDSVENFTTTFRCLLCLPETIQEVQQKLKDTDNTTQAKLCDFLQRHHQHPLVESMRKASRSEFNTLAIEFLQSIENWQIRLFPSVVQQETRDIVDQESRELIKQAHPNVSFEMEAMNQEFGTAAKHIGAIQDMSESSQEIAEEVLQMASAFWQEGKSEEAISFLESFREFQRKRRRLLCEDSFFVLGTLGQAYRTMDQHDKAAVVLSEAGNTVQHPQIADDVRFDVLVKAAGSFMRVGEDANARSAAIKAISYGKSILPIKDLGLAENFGTLFTLAAVVGDVLLAKELAIRIRKKPPINIGLETEEFQGLMTGIELLLNPPHKRLLALDKLQENFETSQNDGGLLTPGTLVALLQFAQELGIRKQPKKAVSVLESFAENLTQFPEDLSEELFLPLKQIGSMYRQFALPVSADKIYTYLFKRHSELYGMTDTRTAKLLLEVATAFQEVSNGSGAASAVNLIEQAIPVLATLGETDVHYLAARNNLANAYSQLGNSNKAIEIFKRLIPLFKEKHGERNATTLGVVASYARALQNSGDLDEARDRFQEVCNLRDEVLGESHPDSIRSWANLGNVELHRGNASLAAELLEKSVLMDMQVNGNQSAESFTTLSNLSLALFKIGRTDEAVEIARDLVPLIIGRGRNTQVIDSEEVTSISNLIEFQVSETDNKAFIEKVQEVRDTLISNDSIDMAQWPT